MSNLVTYAEAELARIGLDDPDNDFYGGMTRDAVIELVRVFSGQGHSGMSATLVTGMVEKLLRFEPLTPLTGADDEWQAVADADPNLTHQNLRCSRVFRRADGTAYDVEGRVFRAPDGVSYTGRGSSVDVTFPYTPTHEYVYVDENGDPL